MNFYSVRDLRTESKNMWENLSNGDEVVITNNGKPAALMLDVSGNNLDLVLQAVRQAKAMIAFNSMRSQAAAKGYLSDEDIEAEINTVRDELKAS